MKFIDFLLALEDALNRLRCLPGDIWDSISYPLLLWWELHRMEVEHKKFMAQLKKQSRNGE